MQSGKIFKKDALLNNTSLPFLTFFKLDQAMILDISQTKFRSTRHLDQNDLGVGVAFVIRPTQHIWLSLMSTMGSFLRSAIKLLLRVFLIRVMEIKTVL